MPATALWFAFVVACKLPDPATVATSDGALAIDSLVEFDPLDIGTDSPAYRELWIENSGKGELSVQAPRIEDGDAFAVSGDRVVLAAGEAYAYGIFFDPQTPFEHAATLVVESDDPAMPEARVALDGVGIAPVLDVGATTVDYGVLPVGCGDIIPVTLRNTGNEVLVVAPRLVGSLELSLWSESDAFEVEPGDEAVVSVHYQPVDATADSATLILDSSDPIRPLTEIALAAAGQDAVSQTDSYEGTALATDIVFVVDNSGSMETEQPALSDNIATFADTLAETAVDYRIGVITTDTSGFAGAVVTSGTKDVATILADQVAALGTGGSGSARALQMLYNCVSPGSDCSESAGFMRPEALLDVIIVSDSAEQSALSPEGYVEYLWTLKANPALVRINAIAGDVPGPPACATCDSPGYGYDQAQVLTDGQFLSVCADWNENLTALAEAAGPALGWFALGQDPITDTIEVSVDGVLVSGWSYVSADDGFPTGAVVFDDDSTPAPGADIEISYTVETICP